MTKAPTTAAEADRQRAKAGEGCGLCGVFVIVAVVIGVVFAIVMTAGG